MLTPDMKRIIEEQRLGFVATAAADGTPNVSPKGTFVVLDDETIGFGEIRSPGTLRNLRANPRVERGNGAFDALLGHFQSTLAPRMRAIVTITVTKALPLTSPVYDDGKTEPELRRAWTAHFRKLQPNERFEE